MSISSYTNKLYLLEFMYGLASFTGLHFGHFIPIPTSDNSARFLAGAPH